MLKKSLADCHSREGEILARIPACAGVTRENGATCGECVPWRLNPSRRSPLLLLATEMLIRACGVVDFPTYLVGSDIGYLPRQPARNLPAAQCMGVQRPQHGHAERLEPHGTAQHPAYRQQHRDGRQSRPENKLGPLLQNDVGNRYAVWPIAAGELDQCRQETAYLDRNPDVARAANYFMWEYVSQGLSAPSEWHGEYVWPLPLPSGEAAVCVSPLRPAAPHQPEHERTAADRCA